MKKERKMKMNQNNIIQIDQRSNIPVEINFYDNQGNLLNPTFVTVRLVYVDRKNNRLNVEHRSPSDTDPEFFKNCYIKDNRFFAKFENLDFVTGELSRELWLKEEITPDKGDNFKDGEMKCVSVEKSTIVITSGTHEDKGTIITNSDACSIIPVEIIVFPSVEYIGLTISQAEVIVADFIESKHMIADAINAKGGRADKTDSSKELADEIFKLVPAQPVFKTSGNLNPKWTDLQSKIAENYREDRKYCWAFSFIGDNTTIQLSGGDYYVCSDGYETDQSGAHTFEVNTDATKTDNWVIIYTQTPVIVFPDDLSLIGTAFYNTSPEQVKFQGKKVIFISQAGTVDSDTMTLPDYFAQNTRISYFIIPEGVKDLTIGQYAFDGCTSMIDMQLSGLDKLRIKSFALQNTSGIYELDLPEIVLDDYAFRFYQVNKLTIKADILTLGGFLFASSSINELHIENPKHLLVNSAVSSGYAGKIITLGDNWDWSINLYYAPNQTIESAYQNVKALSDRTGKTPNTLVLGAKLQPLLAMYPDAATIASNKNWNLT